MYSDLLGQDDELFNCPSCTEVYCVKCRRMAHINKTCKEFDNEINNKDIEDQLRSEAKLLGLKTCPHCKTTCERISGCKFMRCYSKQCKGKKNFCLLCEKPLTERQHYDHYKNKGPFGEICNFLDGTPDYYLF